MRGAFRLSIVAALLAGGYTAIKEWWDRVSSREAAFQRSYTLHNTIACGARLSDAQLKIAVISSGLIDLQKAGCSSERFLTNFKEIEEARASDAYKLAAQSVTPINWSLIGTLAAMMAVAAFVAVNALGLLAIAIRAVTRWVVGGFRTGA